ncbi:HU family DNA-binding protein, partial [Ralstonia pseudosolanacearum]|uniref:HU family DNA-binding protein n=1 Tax=Ralstonia pseudosolanacearum TaxID=1310165 RepID=UPI003D176D07
MTTKSELVAAIAKDAELSNAAAERALNSALENIKKTVAKGGTITLVGFGSFSSGKRAARTGRNPRTGEADTRDAPQRFRRVERAVPGHEGWA